VHDFRERQVETVRVSQPVRRLAQFAPGLLFVVTMVDDPVFGSLIVAAELTFGTPGLLVACCGFVVLSTLMAAATAWALQTEPIQLSAKNRDRIVALQNRRMGRYLVPHPERPVTTMVAAVVFGSVAPIIVAALEPSATQRAYRALVLTSGIAYGMAFASGYGLFGAVIGSVA
jgi:hypothetical protein